jgi:VanZ family protein
MKFLKKTFRIAYLPAVLMMATLYGLSAIPGNPNKMFFLHADKILHLIAYSVLTFSLCLCIRKQRWSNHPYLYALLVLIVGGLFGAFDEYHQSYVPGRDVSLYDWYADMAGITTSLLIWVFLKLYKRLSIY